MDISVLPASTSYATQGVAQTGRVGIRETGSGSQVEALRADIAPAGEEAQPARDETGRKNAPVTESTRSPGFQFEYEGTHQVVKVHDGKGVLIYQVPSKGQLALIEAQDNPTGQQISLSA